MGVAFAAVDLRIELVGCVWTSLGVWLRLPWAET